MTGNFKDWLSKLKPHERNALTVLAIFLLAALIFAFGTQIGGAVFQALN
ncbi:MAG: hypothetical protein ACQRW7_01920 [Caulobacterales bacterium]